MRCHAPPEATRRPVEAEDRLVEPHHPTSLRCAGAPRECPQQAFGKPEQPEALCHHEATRHGGAERDRPRRPVDRDDPMRSSTTARRAQSPRTRPARPSRGQVDGDARGRGKGANAAPDQQLSPDELAADLCHRQQGIHRVTDPAHPEQEGPSWPVRSEDQRCPAESREEDLWQTKGKNRQYSPGRTCKEAEDLRRIVRQYEGGDNREPDQQADEGSPAHAAGAAYASASPGRPGRL